MDADRELMRLGIRGDVANVAGSEDGDVGFCAHAQSSPVSQFQTQGGEAGHATDSFRQRKDLAVTDVAGEDAGERAVGAGMGLVLRQFTCRVIGDAIGADHGVRVA